MANVSNTTSTTTPYAMIDLLADVTREAFTDIASLIKRNEVRSAEDREADRAKRSADRKKVNEVDEKADLANYKADGNEEDLNAVVSKLHAHQQEIVKLHRNDATREVELLLHRLVIIAVVAYLWWIGQA